MATAIDEDTLIAIGFVLAAVILLVLIFIWVLVYCLCCRKNSQGGYGRSKRLIRHSADIETDSAFYVNTSGTQRNLPQTPSESADSRNSSSLASSSDHSHIAVPPRISYHEEIYSYCDDISNILPQYQAPVLPETHAYEGMQKEQARSRDQQNQLNRENGIPHRPLTGETSFTNGGYVDFIDPSVEQDEHDQYDDNSLLQRRGSTASKGSSENRQVTSERVTTTPSKSKTAESQSEGANATVKPQDSELQYGGAASKKTFERSSSQSDDSKMANTETRVADTAEAHEPSVESKSLIPNPIDNKIYYVDSDADHQESSPNTDSSARNQSQSLTLSTQVPGPRLDEPLQLSSTPDYQNPLLNPDNYDYENEIKTPQTSVARSDIKLDTEDYQNNTISRLNSQQSCQQLVSGPAIEHPYYNVVDLNIDKSQEYVNLQQLKDSRISSPSDSTKSKSSGQLVTEKTSEEIPDDSEALALSSEVTTMPNDIKPTPQPRPSITSLDAPDQPSSFQDESLVLDEELDLIQPRDSRAPKPTPRNNGTPANPPPYDQIVDYGQ